MKRPKRLRRCQLSVPASSEKLIASARNRAVDYVFLDLEDSVAPNAKEEARERVIKAVNEGAFRCGTIAARVNELSSQWALDDITRLVAECGATIDVIILPKVKDAEEIRFADRLITMLEAKHGIDKPIGLEVLIEEVEAMMNVEAIAASSPRLEALIFGMGDYAASQGIVTSGVGETDDYPGDLFHYHRNRVSVAARVAGIAAIDGPFADFNNAQKYREEARRAALLGFQGKWAIHPAQIELAEEIFSPDPAVVEKAMAISDAYEKARARGEGAIQVEGKMVDVASVRIFNDMIALAGMIADRDRR
ncbi:MAG: malyl-CoA lyase [Rhizobiaceae bacterium MnEN-MB40S]|nr:MAG: malyl-CoA lyase [Rhizobiaceae bacterium MnEN-MB40S]